MPESPALSVRDARRRFGTVQALDGATFEMRAGETLGLLGPNGAGKTTLVKAISGRLLLDSGSLELLGQPLTGSDESARLARSSLGVVPQEIALYPALTAAENLAVMAAFHGVPKGLAADRIAWALQWTGLQDRAGEPIRQFSGGMKRRLNLAAGVLHGPKVVLLDEPTVGVDPQSGVRIWEMLRELRAAGASILLTTHHLDEAERVCDRIVVIDKGKAIATGTLAELINGTVGPGRLIKLALDGEIPEGIAGAQSSGKVLTKVADDVADALRDLLEVIAARGRRVEDISIKAPTLHDVFIHLTGRELRE